MHGYDEKKFKKMTQEVKILAGIGLLTVIILAVGLFFLAKPKEEVTVKVDQSKLIRTDSYQTSSSSAKVNLVEFADFQCPACKLSQPVVKKISEEYKEKVNIVFRHFPLQQHQNARVAARASEAAGEQGKFFEMHDKIYDSQPDWETITSPEELFVKFAQELGLDIVKFKDDLRSGKYEDKINRDIADGTSLGVNSTPTFFLNDRLFTLAPNYDNLKLSIDQLINK